MPVSITRNNLLEVAHRELGYRVVGEASLKATCTTGWSSRAMKAGALDFLTKPVKDSDLLEAIRRAENREAEDRQRLSELESIPAKIKTLTPREREVVTQVVAGLPNKQIAHDHSSDVSKR